MANVEIPETLLGKLGPAMAMDLHVVHVTLKDGRKFRNLAVSGGRVITGKASAPNGESDLDFSTEDIICIKRSWSWWLF